MTWEMLISYATDPVFIGLVGGVILSYLVEFWPQFGELAPARARLVFFGLCLVAALAITALGVATGVRGQWDDVAMTWWPAVYAAIAAMGTGTLAHTRMLK